MTECLNHIQIFVGTCEIRRSRYQEILSTANPMVYPGMSTKWILRVEPVGIVTAGLPKYLKIYGNGGLILAARLSKRSYTTRGMSRECEVVQHNNLTSFNLVTGRCKLNYSTNTNINRRKIYSEIRDTATTAPTMATGWVVAAAHPTSLSAPQRRRRRGRNSLQWWRTASARACAFFLA